MRASLTNPTIFKKSFFRAVNLLLSLISTLSLPVAGQSTVGDLFTKMTPQSDWKLVAKVPLQFNAHHTQGLVKIGGDFYMTAVEVKRWPERFSEKKGKFDRDTGEGVGHLFRFNDSGVLLDDVVLGKDSIYHPGGLDFDGQNLWIPVCEYRPLGNSIVYRYNLKDRIATEVFSVEDALGAMAVDLSSGILWGTNWGSRDFYKWKINKDGQVQTPFYERKPNPSFYVDYQDCHRVGNGRILCSGLRSYDSGVGTFRLGGLDLIDLSDLRPVHQLPVNLYSDSGRVLTNNPVWLEVLGNALRAYFVPDDDEGSVLYVYDIFPSNP